VSQFPGVVSISDGEGKVVYVNRYYEKIYNKSPDSWLGSRCSELFGNKAELDVAQHEETVLKNEDQEEIEEVRVGNRRVTFLTKTFPIGQGAYPLLNGRIALDISKRKRLYKKLRDKENEVTTLSNKILNVHEEERKLIARELHDTVASSLSAIKLSLERNLNQHEEATKYPPPTLEEIIAMVERTINEVRKIMGDLRPSMLDDLGIVPTISAYCREFEKIHPSFTVQKQTRIEENEVPEHLKVAIFRILQEALTNVGKYSNGNAVSVSLGKTGGSIEFSVRDNGRGFSPNSHASRTITEGLGISSMRERTRLSGGYFSIDSLEGAGTTVKAIWPLDGLSRS